MDQSQPYDEQRSCRTKKRYPCEEDANAVAAYCYAERGEYLRVYACTMCGGYHLTKQRVEVKEGWREPRPSMRAMAAQRNREIGRRGRRSGRRR